MDFVGPELPPLRDQGPEVQNGFLEGLEDGECSHSGGSKGGCGRVEHVSPRVPLGPKEKIVSQKKEKTGEEWNREDQPTDLIVVTTLATEAVTSSAGQGGVEHLDRLAFSRKDLITIDGVDPEIGIGFEADTITAMQTSSLEQLHLNDSLSLALDGEKNSLINPSFFGSRGSGRPTRLAGHFELPFVDLTLSGDKPFSFF
ncbi:hypothetical protein NE237_015513 [Protea cynaroides]|uniref:Uncharacterized protein n=1 Tax=Protea cynaroides TaxID=273540 RepID=A0A9Q0KE57_9MAGN|nr:hypothetical protein NE237_015513 [Protea cynaroides]